MHIVNEFDALMARIQLTQLNLQLFSVPSLSAESCALFIELPVAFALADIDRQNPSSGTPNTLRVV